MGNLEKMKELIFQNLYDLTLVNQEYRERINSVCSVEIGFSSLISLGRDLAPVESQLNLLSDLIMKSDLVSDYAVWIETHGEEDNNDNV